MSVIGLLLPLRSFAATSVSFGGFDTAMLPCTCEAGSFSWQFFMPLYLNNPTPTFGAMVAPPIVGFSTYYVRPSTWALGTYIPAAGVCMIGVEPYCFSMPNLGLISPETGVSPVAAFP